jgi:tight adherence protein B
MRKRARFGAITGAVVVALSVGPAAAASPIVAAGAPKSWLIILGAVAAGLGVFLLLVILFGGGRSKRDAAISGRMSSYGQKQEKATGFFGRFRLMRRAVSKAESMAESSGNTRMIESALEQANIPVRPGEAIVGAIGIAIILGLLLGLITQSSIWGVAAGALVLIFSFLYVSRVASKQRKKFGAQLADTLNLLATSLRAGYSILQAIEGAAQEAPEPSRREFGRAMAEIRLGRPMIDSLGDIAVRMESKDFEWAVLAIAIQREVGGNLSEVLQSTAETILHRDRFRREVKALTAEGRFSAWIMALMPLVVFLAVFLMNPDYVAPLYTTTVGVILIAGALLLMAAGVFWMMKIVNIDV